MKDFVQENFTKEAVNNLNALFYSSLDEDIYNTGLASIYTDSSAVFMAFNDLLKSQEKFEKPLRIKQLSAGNRALNMWKRIAKMKSEVATYQIEITDFQQPVFSPGEVMDLHEMGVEVMTDSYSFFDDFCELSLEERFDVMVVTYGFDSVWLPEDGFFEKDEGKWFQVKYRLMVENEDKDVRDLMKNALEKGESDLKLCEQWFSGVKVEEKREEINILDFPYGNEIADYYRDLKNVRCSFPGTLIKRVEEAFEKQLNDDGLFVIGDVMVADKEMAANFNRGSVCRSGVGARYKVDDYGLGKFLLEKKGFKVDLKRLDEFVDHYKGYDAEFDCKLGERGRDFNYVCVVSR